MDVLVLIDKLDDLVHNAKAVPLTDQVRIDREEIYDILDQMRATIPEEIKQARWIVKERQEMLAEAKRECDRILGEAREQAVREASPRATRHANASQRGCTCRRTSSPPRSWSRSRRRAAAGRSTSAARCRTWFSSPGTRASSRARTASPTRPARTRRSA